MCPSADLPLPAPESIPIAHRGGAALLRTPPGSGSRRQRFTGEETVEITVREPVGEVILNAVQLEIRGASIQDGDGRTLMATVTLEEATERIRLGFGEALSPGVWRLSLVFAGALSQRLQGFYLSQLWPPRPSR